jgi:hypothetical protein
MTFFLTPSPTALHCLLPTPLPTRFLFPFQKCLSVPANKLLQSGENFTDRGENQRPANSLGQSSDPHTSVVQRLCRFVPRVDAGIVASFLKRYAVKHRRKQSVFLRPHASEDEALKVHHALRCAGLIFHAGGGADACQCGSDSMPMIFATSCGMPARVAPAAAAIFYGILDKREFQ